MLVSKTFAYALRSILYLSLVAEVDHAIQLRQIAKSLNIPKHFLAKILQQFSKSGILESVKGPNGGFRLTDKTMKTRLIEIFELTDSAESFNFCALRFTKCNNNHPCPLHNDITAIRTNLISLLSDVTIYDLINSGQPLVLKNIAS
jgi:Rrf2 family transcriptional regulator, iron-sulfur cluster assembly transcription factor